MNKINSILIQIDNFIKKYYQNQLLKGALFLVMIFLFSLCVISALEYFGRFNQLIRFILFTVFMGTNIVVVAIYCIVPLLKLIKFRKGISTIDASKIIGDFFPEISDKLTNVIQLNRELNSEENSNLNLLKASIDQKVGLINPFSFNKAVDYSQTKKYVRYIVPILSVFIFLLIYTPKLFTQGSFRIINFSQEFVEKAPFSFQLINTPLTINEGDDAYINLSLVGTKFPEKIYINSENGSFLMKRTKKNSFEAVIKKPKNGSEFYFSSSKYSSSKYKINVLGKSILGKLDAEIIYPGYIQRENKTIQNSTDIIIPEGSHVYWKGLTKNTKKVQVLIDTMSYNFNRNGFSFNQTMMRSTSLQIVLTNKNTNNKDSIRYDIGVIKDEYPKISVSEISDSMDHAIKYFKGNVSDDYGLKSLNFYYEIKSVDGIKKKEKINFRDVKGTKNSFEFSIDFNRENIKLRDEIKYYFAITDNDGVNGNKTTTSTSFYFELPDLSEVNDIRNKEQENITNDLSDVLNQTREFQKELEELNKKTKNNRTNQWENLNQLNNLKEKQQQLINNLQEIQKNIEKSTNKKNKLSEIDKELLDKQNQIEELLNEVMDEELRKLLEELEKLLKENNKENINKNIDELKQSSEDMKNQLDRSLEMLKKLQLNEKIDDIEKELKALAEEQKKLSDQKEKDLQKQKNIAEEFNKIKEKLRELEKLNKELQNPMSLESTEPEEKSINEELDQAEDKIEKNKNKKSTENQKSAAKKMNELSDKLDAMQQSSKQQQQGEDLESLRNILESLVLLSLDQESLMQKFIKVKINDPAFRKYGRVQRRINDDTKIVRDSLMSLAKRQPSLATFIDQELHNIEFSQKKALEAVGDRKQRTISLNQQIVMTSYNNLALLLNETLQQIQKQMQSQMEGGGACNKPGGKGRPKAGPKMNSGDMKEMLKNQLEQLKKGMKEGGKNQGDKKGDKGKNGKGGLGSEGLSKMAAEQSAIRRKLEQIRNELNKKGKGEGNQLNPLIEELKEQQKNIINKQINKETIQRQHEILTRLLESEKALLERGFEEKRESKSGKNRENGNKIDFKEYNKQKLKQIELLRYAEPLYKKYYKEKANEYFDNN